jgi:hypothetical protein
MENNIKIFTLDTGDDIIGIVMEDDKENYIIKDPFIIRYSTSIRSGISITLRPWCILSDDSLFAFTKKSIVSASFPRQSAADYYMVTKDYLIQTSMQELDTIINENIKYAKNDMKKEQDKSDEKPVEFDETQKSYLERLSANTIH